MFKILSCSSFNSTVSFKTYFVILSILDSLFFSRHHFYGVFLSILFDLLQVWTLNHSFIYTYIYISFYGFIYFTSFKQDIAFLTCKVLKCISLPLFPALVSYSKITVFIFSSCKLFNILKYSFGYEEIKCYFIQQKCECESNLKTPTICS